MGRYRAALRRLDRVLLVAVFLLGALLLALPQHTEPYIETPFAESMAEAAVIAAVFFKIFYFKFRLVYKYISKHNAGPSPFFLSF